MTQENDNGKWLDTEVIESGNYPKKDFVGELESIDVHVKDNGKEVLQVEFADGKTYDLLLRSDDGKYGLHEDGTVDGFWAIGKFLNSLKKLEVPAGTINMNNNDPNVVRLRPQFQWANGAPIHFQTIPSCIGCKIHNVATPKEIGDDQQTKKGSDWPDWTWKQVDGLQAAPATKKPAATNKPAPKPAATTPAASGDTDSSLSDLILTAFEAGNSGLTGIYFALPRKANKSRYKISEIITCIKDELDGAVVLDDSSLSDLILVALDKASGEGKKLGLTDIFKALPSKADKTRYKVAEIRKCITEDLEGAVVLNGEKYEVA